MSQSTNHYRASYAATALEAFRERVGDDDEWTSICDLIVDLGHLAKASRLDFVRIAARAISVWAYERRDPDGCGECPQVTVIVAGRRPKRAWPADETDFKPGGKP